MRTIIMKQNKAFMIYKSCFIVFWKKEVRLPHPVHRKTVITIQIGVDTLAIFLIKFIIEKPLLSNLVHCLT